MRWSSGKEARDNSSAKVTDEMRKIYGANYSKGIRHNKSKFQSQTTKKRSWVL